MAMTPWKSHELSWVFHGLFTEFHPEFLTFSWHWKCHDAEIHAHEMTISWSKKAMKISKFMTHKNGVQGDFDCLVQLNIDLNEYYCKSWWCQNTIKQDWFDKLKFQRKPQIFYTKMLNTIYSGFW